MKTFGKILLALLCGALAYAAVKFTFEVFGSSMKKYYVVKEI